MPIDPNERPGQYAMPSTAGLYGAPSGAPTTTRYSPYETGGSGQPRGFGGINPANPGPGYGSQGTNPYQNMLAQKKPGMSWGTGQPGKMTYQPPPASSYGGRLGMAGVPGVNPGFPSYLPGITPPQGGQGQAFGGLLPSDSLNMPAGSNPLAGQMGPGGSQQMDLQNALARLSQSGQLQPGGQFTPAMQAAFALMGKGDLSGGSFPGLGQAGGQNIQQYMEPGGGYGYYGGGAPSPFAATPVGPAGMQGAGFPQAGQIPGGPMPFLGQAALGQLSGGFSNGLILPGGASPTVFGAYGRARSFEPGMNETIQSLLGGQPALQGYVDQATSGIRSAYEQELANRMAEADAQANAEGAYGGSAAAAYKGQLTANLGAQYLRDLGGMQLGAAEAERSRQTSTALNQSNQFAEMARAALASGNQAQAALLNAMSDAYRTEATTSLGQQQLGAGTGMDLLKLMYMGNQQDFMNQMQMAGAQQAYQQQGLDKLYNAYWQPSQNAMALFNALSGIQNVQKTTGGGFDIGGMLGSLASLGADYLLPGSGMAMRSFM